MKGYFEFYNPVKICAGEDALGNLMYEAKALGMEKPLLLTDETLTKLGVVRRFQEITGLTDCVTFDQVPADSSVHTVNDIAKLCRAQGCHGIVALGGGSVLDTAKGVKLLLSQGKDDILGLMGCENLPMGGRVPYIAVPTTAGTGSECTPVAVIRHPDRSVKLEYINPFMMPDVAVLDARMTQSLPPRITAATGLDALCHAIEAYTCDQKNPMSDAYALAAIGILTKKLPEVVEHGSSPARIDVAVAACMAGAAFGNSMVGAVHAIGHALGGVCHIPHGEAMAILLPWVMDFNRGRVGALYSDLLPYFPGQTDPVEAVRGFIRSIGERSGLPLRLRDTGRFDPACIGEVCEKAVNDGAIIVNPAYLSKEDVAKLLLAAQ